MVQPLEPAEIEAAVNEFQLKLDRLRVLYEQYYLGISKREPLIVLKDVVRLLHLLDQQKIRNTGLRFRLRTLVQKFNVLRTYWSRTNRQIEAGTYKRDVARVRRKYARQGVAMPELGQLRTPAEIERAMAEAAEQVRAKQPDGPQRRRPDKIRGVPASRLQDGATEQPADGGTAADPPGFISHDEADAALDAFFTGAVAPAQSDGAPTQAPPPPTIVARPASTRAAAPRPTPPAPATAGHASPSADAVSQEALRSLYRRMVKAKRMVGENPETVTYEGLARTLNQQMPKLRQLHPGKQIDFQVVIRDGKVVLKAKPT